MARRLGIVPGKIYSSLFRKKTRAQKERGADASSFCKAEKACRTAASSHALFSRTYYPICYIL
jgi:hypothetical protein